MCPLKLQIFAVENLKMYVYECFKWNRQLSIRAPLLSEFQETSGRGKSPIRLPRPPRLLTTTECREKGSMTHMESSWEQLRFPFSKKPGQTSRGWVVWSPTRAYNRRLPKTRSINGSFNPQTALVCAKIRSSWKHPENEYAETIFRRNTNRMVVMAWQKSFLKTEQCYFK